MNATDSDTANSMNKQCVVTLIPADSHQMPVF